MKLCEIVENVIIDYLNEDISSNNVSDYAGEHSAPGKHENDPMHNVETMFPDMYTDNALRYYGGYELDDASVINQIKYVHNRPNRYVKIYRAVPDVNRDIDKKIKELSHLLIYKNRFGFYPIKSEFVNDLETETWKKNPSLKYDEILQEVYSKISNLIDELKSKKEKAIRINNGDWVTTSKLYAKQHGETSLKNRYKIVTKTVKASQLYTDGNSIFEWGYNV